MRMMKLLTLISAGKICFILGTFEEFIRKLLILSIYANPVAKETIFVASINQLNESNEY